MPAKYGQSSRFRALKPNMLRAFAAAERDKNPTRRIGLSNVTIRKHRGNLGSFPKHVRGQGHAIAELELNDLRPRKAYKLAAAFASSLMALQRLASTSS